MRDFFQKRAFLYLCLALCLFVLWPLAFPVIAGLVVAYLSETPLLWMQQKFHIHRKSGRAVLLVGWMLLTLATVFLPLTWALYQGGQELVQFLPNSKALWPTFLQQTTSWFRHLGAGIERFLSISWIAEVSERLRATLTTEASHLVGMLADWIRATPLVLFHVFLFLLSWFFFAWLGPLPRQQFLQQLIPFDKERILLTSTTTQVLRGVVLATLLVALAQALVLTGSLAILWVPHPLLIGFLGFFAAFLPFVGISLISVSTAIYLFAMHRTGAGIVMVVVAVLVSVVDNLLRPLIVKNHFPLSFFWAFLAFAGGVSVFGVAGILLGPLFVSLAANALRALKKEEPSLVL